MLRFLLFTVSMTAYISAYPHSGRTDSNGGHYNRSTGTYHYHSGPRTRSYSRTPTESENYSYPFSSSTQSNDNAGVKLTENDWQVAFCNLLHGKMEVTCSAGRVDILTLKSAIEVEYLRNYREGIYQAVKYGQAMERNSVLAVIVEQTDSAQTVKDAKSACEAAGVKFIVINDYVNETNLKAEKTAKTSSTGANYWLNTKSGVRHNSRCRWYGTTSSGRKATASEGRACGQCGG